MCRYHQVTAMFLHYKQSYNRVTYFIYYTILDKDSGPFVSYY